jgi:hypothetical protein
MPASINLLHSSHPAPIASREPTPQNLGNRARFCTKAHKNQFVFSRTRSGVPCLPNGKPAGPLQNSKSGSFRKIHRVPLPRLGRSSSFLRGSHCADFSRFLHKMHKDRPQPRLGSFFRPPPIPIRVHPRAFVAQCFQIR